MSQSEIILTVENLDPVELFGENNSKLNLIRRSYPDATITSRGSLIKISGKKKDTQAVKEKMETMVRWLRERKELPVQTVEDLLSGENPFQQQQAAGENKTILVQGRDGRVIYARTKNQQRMVQASSVSDVVFAIGPAGTGKTYTAVALAVRALKNREVKKIILTRPAIEAGENLGFLPGDLKEKIDPYLRPLYDALDDMIPAERLAQLMENRVIEIAPLAFMRGRTLDHAFIILDEAQNCTPLQLKMFLTRIGPSAKCIITGDLSQIDLPYKQVSGLRQATRLLQNIFGIDTIYLDNEDVVRHRLVKDILRAYDRHDEKRRREEEEEE
ncbi:MAG: PhoH family protein [Saprospiraceae bacterium]|nr:PhoH family protein [Saprospiraceae bacterium]MBP9208688.1 PhoH family protein [Saprospiraceae bacterium]MBV6472246.1 PhoH-like protein [Saprospiraceae bacterium]